MKARRNAPLRRGLETLWMAPRTLVRLRDWLAAPSWFRIALAGCVLAAAYGLVAFTLYQVFYSSGDTRQPYLILVGLVLYFPSFVVLIMFNKMLHDGVGYYAKQLIERRARDWSHGYMTARSSLALFVVGATLYFAPIIVKKIFPIVSGDMIIGWLFLVGFTIAFQYGDTRKKIFETAEKRRRYCTQLHINPKPGCDVKLDQIRKPHLSVWDKTL